MNEDGNSFLQLDSQYGIDYTTLVHSTMETPERNEYIQKLVRAYRYWMDVEDKERGEVVAQKIKQEAGENSRVYQELKRK